MTNASPLTASEARAVDTRPKAVAEAQIPHCPGLWIKAQTGLSDTGTPLSATGVGTSLDVARQRAASEWAERSALHQSGAFPRPSPLIVAAAHPDPARALDHAWEEAVERVAVALWWSGQHKARQPDAEMTSAAAQAAQDWQRKPGRPIALIDLSLPGLAAVCLAWSLHGARAVFGLGAGTDRAQAVRGALRELAQMEFGAELDAARGTQTVTTIDPEMLTATSPCEDERSALGAPKNWPKALRDLGVAFEPIQLPHASLTIMAGRVTLPAGQAWRTPWDDDP